MPCEYASPGPAASPFTGVPIAIVGGGLGGLALAIGLCKHNINVHIYEAAAEYSEIGAGVSFGHNSVAALRHIDARLLEGYKKHATLDAARDRHSTFMTVRWGMDERREHGHKAGDSIWCMKDIWHPERAVELGVATRSSIHRARLLQELVDLIPEGTTSFNKSFEDVKEMEDGNLMLHFKDGTTARACALIGCDGVKSKVRKAVCDPKVQPKYASEVAYRAMIPRATAEAVLGPEAALNGHIYAGYGGYIVTYPVEHGDIINLNAMIRDVDGSQEWSHSDWTVPVSTEEILCRFRDWYEPLVGLLTRYHLPSKWALFCLQHDEPYYRGRICLLGDSAHATTPHMGAGAGMAMEDAYILSSLIASLVDPRDLESAFRAYDVVRRPRTQSVIERSLDAGIKYSFMHPNCRDDTKALKEQLEEAHRLLWHNDLEADLQRAKMLLKRSSVPE